MTSHLPADFITKLQAVTAKRARVVIDHLLEHGQITTDDLKITYGYDHPPRAIRDVRDFGIPIEMKRVQNQAGKSISAYVFGDPAKTEWNKTGRKAFPKQFKASLVSEYGARCGICNTQFEDRYLQIDHRVPYEIAGESSDQNVLDFMLVCGSCNRAKSWSCEHCPNRDGPKDASVCATCYWAQPIHYKHIATRGIRRIDIVWSEKEVSHFDIIKASAAATGQDLPTFIKTALQISPTGQSHPPAS